MVGVLLALPSGLQRECCPPLGRSLHALWHRAAAVDGLGGHGSLFRVCGSLITAAEVVSSRVAGGTLHMVLLRPWALHAQADLGRPVPSWAGNGRVLCSDS